MPTERAALTQHRTARWPSGTQKASIHDLSPKSLFPSWLETQLEICVHTAFRWTADPI